MKRSFEPVVLASDQEVCFVCVCCQGEERGLSFDTYNRPDTHGELRPVECSTCRGSGFIQYLATIKECPACEGSGVCSNCHGKYAREWEELPSEHQEAIFDEWEGELDFFESLPAQLTINRNW